MPLKLTAGVSKKLGLPGYSSVGAICHVEMDLDSGLIQKDPQAFRAQVREVYAQCAESVEEELARHQAPHSQSGPGSERPAAGSDAADGAAASNGHAGTNGHAGSNGHAGTNGNGHGNGHAQGELPGRSNGRVRSRPSARQLEYARELAGRVGMDAEQLAGLAQRLFSKPLGEISGGEASGLIRALQEMREGWLGAESTYRPEGE